MSNISLNGEAIKLKPNSVYYFIDALYIMDVKNNLDILNTIDTDKQLREIVFAFPCTDTPFAKYYTNADIFSIEKIKRVSYNNIETKDSSYFSTDTGLLIVIKDNLMLGFSRDFSYDELLNTEVDLFNIPYWNNLASKYNTDDLALVSSPGVGSSFDLQGSGTYQVK